MPPAEPAQPAEPGDPVHPADPVGDAGDAGRGAAPRLWPLYAGGFLGPFAGAMTGVMLPELADGLGTTISGASLAVSWFMVPFAAALLFSGTLASRWGQARVVRTAFVAYAASSLVGVFATALPPFLAGRAFQGLSNAFTTPLLIAMLAALTPPERRGRAMGIFASMQASGTAFAPVIGGAAAAVDYRLAFGAAAAVALALAALMPTTHAVPASGAATEREKWAALRNRELARTCVIGFCLQFTATGVGILVALLAHDRFGLDAAQRGLVTAGFGVAGLLTGTLTGRLADRYGLRVVGAGAMALLGLGIATAAVAPWLWLLVLVTFLAGIGNTGSRVTAQSLAVRSTPANPAGATSFALSMQFLGGAVFPVAVPAYQVHPQLTCIAVGAVALGGALVAGTRIPRQASSPSASS